jgi:hypothetical protein
VTTTVTGSFSGLNIVDNGTISVAADGTLTLDGSLGGSGAINICSGASLVVENGGGQATAATAPTITFEGTGDTLTIYGSALNASHDFVPTISGLDASDMIDYEGTVTSARYSDGVLTLFDGASAIAFLTLLGNYSGDTFSVAAIGGGVTQIVDPPTVTATITNGGTLVVNASTSETIDFAGGTGMLVLNQPQSFSGQIVGFTGTAPDTTHSDAIDLTGINYDSSHFSETYNASTDILTVTDGAHTAYLSFDDFQGTFEFASDGKGGTIIYDPPAAGAKDAPATATAAPGNDHVAASASHNGTDHVANPANEAAFGGDQSLAVNSDIHNGSDATPATNELAPATGALALGSGPLAGATGEAGFGGDQAAAGNSSEADGAVLTNVTNGGFNPSPLSSLLHVLTGGDAGAPIDTGGTVDELSAGTIQISDGTSTPVAVITPGTPVLTDSTIVDGSGTANSEVTSSAVPTAPANEHAVAPAAVTSPPPAASPTVASATFGASGDDNFTFHPNLGNDTAQNTGGATNDLAHNNVQIAGAAPASIVPEFHQEFAFDAVHHDDAQLALTLDQLHQMAASSTLLH